MFGNGVQVDLLVGNNFSAAGAIVGGLAQKGFDPGWYRPFIDQHGYPCLTINTGRSLLDNKTGNYVPEFKTYRVDALRRAGHDVPFWHLINNATTLTKQAWQQELGRVIKANRTRLKAAADLQAMSTITVDPWSKMTLEYPAMNDPGEAVIDMDPVTPGRRDRPLQLIHSLPLPFVHSDYDFTRREMGVSEGTSMPLRGTMSEAAGRRVGEAIEGLTIGTVTGPTYGTITAGPGTHTGTSSVWGYTNFPYRVTKTDLTTPTGTNPEAVMTDILEMVEVMQTNGFYGPYRIYHSTGYSRYLSDDYFRSGSTSAVRSLRQRILEIEGIEDLRRLDNLTSGYQMIMINMDAETAAMVVGLETTLIQWEAVGGLRRMFKVLACKVPILFAKYNGTAGILHATTS